MCCIYHKPKPVDESSDESSSDSSSDSDSDSEPEGARPAGGKRQSCGHGHDHGRRGRKSGGKGKEKTPKSATAPGKLKRRKSTKLASNTSTPKAS